MPMGFVYVLFNPAFADKVKIGLTIGTAEQRAAALYGTGVPARFHVVYDELVSDCSKVEQNMHGRFAAFRNNEVREFFDVPMKTAVRALIEEASSFRLPKSALSKRAEVLPKLRKKFPKCISSGLSSIAIIQLEGLNLLQLSSKSSEGHEEILEQVDLDFIGGIETMLPPDSDVRDNVDGFVSGMSLATLLVISEALLSDAGRETAIIEYNHGLPPSEPEPVDEKDAPTRPR